MSVEFFVRAILIASLALFTSACGGGGGGGSDAAAVETDTGSNTDTDENTENEDTAGNEDEAAEGEETIPPFDATQHELLPLIEGTTITYDDGQSVTVTKDDDLSDETTTVYAVNYGDMVQYFSSTPEQILLHGVDGTFSIDDINTRFLVATNVSFDKVRFSPPLPVVTEGKQPGVNQIEPGGTATATVTANINGSSVPSSFSGIPANIQDDSFSTEFLTKVVDTPTGIFTTKNIQLDITISGSILANDFSASLNDSIFLTPGLGIVKRVANYSNDAIIINHTLTSVTNLPHPITFTRTLATPTPSIPQNTPENTYDQDRIFNLSGGENINSEMYDIANMKEINAAGWIEIIKDTINNNYTINILDNDSLPTGNTSTLIMFQHNTLGTELPTSLNLITTE